jgi:hypothetical protein
MATNTITALTCAMGFLVKDVERLRAILAEVESSIMPAVGGP